MIIIPIKIRINNFKLIISYYFPWFIKWYYVDNFIVIRLVNQKKNFLIVFFLKKIDSKRKMKFICFLLYLVLLEFFSKP